MSSNALVYVQGIFLNAKKVETDYSAATGGALIYPSVNVEGSESATRHAARLMGQRRIEGKELESAIVAFAQPIPTARHYGTEEIAALLTGREYRIIGKMPSGLKLAHERAKRATASAARKAEKLAAMPAEVLNESEVNA